MIEDKSICKKSDLTSIADTVRSKLGVTDTYYVSELSDAIERIPTGTQLPTLTNPGTTADLVSGKELIDQNGSVITGTNPYEKSSTDTAIANETVLISQIQTALNNKASVSPVIKSLTVTENGTYTTNEGVDGFSPVIVNIDSPNLQVKSLTYTTNGTTTITPDTGYDGLSSVNVTVSIPIYDGGVS